MRIFSAVSWTFHCFLFVDINTRLKRSKEVYFAAPTQQNEFLKKEKEENSEARFGKCSGYELFQMKSVALILIMMLDKG